LVFIAVCEDTSTLTNSNIIFGILPIETKLRLPFELAGVKN
jgi:hypothetical protein